MGAFAHVLALRTPAFVTTDFLQTLPVGHLLLDERRLETDLRLDPLLDLREERRFEALLDLLLDLLLEPEREWDFLELDLRNEAPYRARFFLPRETDLFLELDRLPPRLLDDLREAERLELRRRAPNLLAPLLDDLLRETERLRPFKPLRLELDLERLADLLPDLEDLDRLTLLERDLDLEGALLRAAINLRMLALVSAGKVAA